MAAKYPVAVVTHNRFLPWPPRRRTGAVGAVLLLFAVLLSACSSGTSADPAGAPPELSRFYTQKLAWADCGEPFQCANLTVPLNYADPGGRTIELSVVRATATDPAHRIGSLLTNPGGPGGSGLQFVRQSYPAGPGEQSGFDEVLRADYDIIGFDPRGVGRSAPVTCLTDPQRDQFAALNTTPTTAAQVNTLVASYQAFAAGCQARSGAELPYLGTPNAARDMDVLRAVLGDAKLNYLGYSYGTYLGAVYAQLFPQRVGRLVLDGPLPPDETTRQLDVQQAQGFESELRRFIADCVTHPGCPLGTDPRTAATAMSGLFDSAQATPIPAGDERTLDGALAQTGVISAMYDSPGSWAGLRKALAAALAGHGHKLLKLADQYNERHHNGTYSNSNEANTAINCLDHPSAVHSVADVQAALPEFAKASPLTGASSGWEELMCAYWPVPPQSQPAPIHYAGTPPILVVGTTNDPATPYPGAQAMASQLGSAVLLTENGDGHTAYGRDSACINASVDRYLAQGVPPAAGTTCQPNPSVEH